MEQPRPQVTVTDPREREALVAVEEPPPLRLGRRGAALLAAAALVGATALFVTDVARARGEAVEQRRLDRVVDLALGEASGPWSSAHDARTGTGTVTGVVRLVNRGPRPVRVTGAQFGRLRSTQEPVLPAGGDDTLLLERTIRCPADGGPPAPEPEGGQLRVRLETPAGTRQVLLRGDGLPMGSLDGSVQRACRHPPLGESVQLAGTVVRSDDRTVVLHVDLANGGRVPVRLLSLVPARGLVVVSVEGDATSMPLVLPASMAGSPTVRTLEVRLGVVCSALLGADLLRPFEELSAIVEDEERSQITSVGALSSDPGGQLRQLAGRTCSSG